MAPKLAQALLPLLAVSMVTTAAPLAEPAQGGELAVAATGDRGDNVNIDKRQKEEIVFGNQQNSVRMGAGSKKSLDLADDHQQQQQQASSSLENSPPAPQPPQQPQEQAPQPSSAEGPTQEEAEQEPEVGDVDGEKEEGQQPETSEENSKPAEAAEDGSRAEDAEEPQTPASAPSSPEEPQQPAVQQTAAEEPAEPQAEEAQPAPAKEEGEQELQNDQLSVEEGGMKGTPEVSGGENPEPTPSENTDSEQALQTLTLAHPENVEDTTTNNNDDDEDDVEHLLEDLHTYSNVPAEGSESGGEEKQGAEAETGAGAEGDEGSVERELMQVTSQQGSEGNAARQAYSQSLLKYILSHGDEYGRLPTPNNAYLFQTDPYYLQRRRRSLPHIHRRHKTASERQLSRAKRTKRDLFDDNLYYNADPRFDLEEAMEAEREREAEEEEEEEEREREEEEEEEEEKNAELRELLTYLMALYPSLYDSERPSLPFPGYMWQGSSYPEEEPYWEEPTVYQEPQVGWGEPQMEVPAWEPSFYPEEEMEEEEEEEEPEYYPAVAKRQMMSFVPGQRRKRYFFPFAREPYTHWGAFVPSQQKRDYYGEDPYRRLKELALVLAEDREPSSSYFDDLDEYKKKK